MARLTLELNPVTVESFVVEPRDGKAPGWVEALVTAGHPPCIRTPYCREG